MTHFLPSFDNGSGLREQSGAGDATGFLPVLLYTDSRTGLTHFHLRSGLLFHIADRAGALAKAMYHLPPFRTTTPWSAGTAEDFCLRLAVKRDQTSDSFVIVVSSSIVSQSSCCVATILRRHGASIPPFSSPHSERWSPSTVPSRSSGLREGGFSAGPWGPSVGETATPSSPAATTWLDNRAQRRNDATTYLPNSHPLQSTSRRHNPNPKPHHLIRSEPRTLKSKRPTPQPARDSPKSQPPE